MLYLHHQDQKITLKKLVAKPDLGIGHLTPTTRTELNDANNVISLAVLKTTI